MRLRIAARNQVLDVEHGRIAEPRGGCDLTLDFATAELRPGLINAHDHLHRNHYGRLGRPPYPNAYAWAADIAHRHRRRIATGQLLDRREALLRGAWKNLFAGVTTVMHHDRWEPDFEHGFPVRLVRIPSADSLGMDAAPERIAGDGPFCLHVAEGVDPIAAGEVAALAERGLLDARLVAVHGVGIDADGARRFRAAGAALTWCPSSNLFLFGRTASREVLRGGDVLLGSDSRLTGHGNLLDELRCARALGLIEDAVLERAVGATAARRFGLPKPQLAPGAIADLVVLARPLLDARAADVLLVLIDGLPRLARPDVALRFGDLAPPGRLRRMGRVVRWTAD